MGAGNEIKGGGGGVQRSEFKVKITFGVLARPQRGVFDLRNLSI